MSYSVYMNVACPTCQVNVGARCRTFPKGAPTDPHSARKKRYFREKEAKKTEKKDT